METERYYNLSLNFICKLEGYKTLLKNIHWSAPQLTYHREIDDLLDEVIEFQDIVAEESMGYMGEQFKMGDLKGVMDSLKDPLEILKAIHTDTMSFYSSIKSDDSLIGVVNAVNDFQQGLLKFLYLFPLAAKDGCDMESSNSTTMKKPSALASTFKGVHVELGK